MKYLKKVWLTVSIMSLGMSGVATAETRTSFSSFDAGPVQTNCAWTQPGEQQNCSITFSGSTGQATRAFWMYIPKNLDPTQGIVFYFHASGPDWDFAGNGMWESVSDRNGFAFIAAQNGSCETGWGNSCTDDQADFLALVSAVETNLQIPPNKIFIHGFSAGGPTFIT